MRVEWYVSVCQLSTACTYVWIIHSCIISHLYAQMGKIEKWIHRWDIQGCSCVLGVYRMYWINLQLLCLHRCPGYSMRWPNTSTDITVFNCILALRFTWDSIELKKKYFQPPCCSAHTQRGGPIRIVNGKWLNILWHGRFWYGLYITHRSQPK